MQDQLTRIARDLTVQRGLTGFTVAELCAQAGISPRTFFNHYAAKEDAVLALPLHAHDDADQRFLAGADDERRAGLTVTLLDDLLLLAEQRWERVSLTADDVRQAMAIVEREPRLHARLLQHFQAWDRATITLVEQRERLEPGDLRASTVVHLVTALHRATAEEFLHAGAEAGSDPAAFGRRLRARADVVRSLFS